MSVEEFATPLNQLRQEDMSYELTVVAGRDVPEASLEAFFLLAAVAHGLWFVKGISKGIIGQLEPKRIDSVLGA
jgi:hypothetical protein